MSPEIQERARLILNKTGAPGEIFKLLAINEKIYFATDNMAQTNLLNEAELPHSIKEAIEVLVSKQMMSFPSR